MLEFLIVKKKNQNLKVLTNARLFVTFIRMHETHFAFATERSWVVETLAVLAQTRIVGTLVDILTNVSISAESSVTDALRMKVDEWCNSIKFSHKLYNHLERSFCVDTLSVLIATTVVG